MKETTAKICKKRKNQVIGLILALKEPQAVGF
jgi:hypothetical protein